jgi:3-methyl-2-oxobutanoate hydroxymethyltransferase
MKRVTDFARFRNEARPISMVTCYDAWSASLLAGSPIDAVLVGDSVAMVMHGYPDTVHATVRMMEFHTAAVRRGIGGEAFIIADMPFAEHRKGKVAAMRCVERLMRAGANAVKIEGAEGHLEVIEHIIGSGVPVMGHLGLTPQSVHLFGGHRLQGRGAAEAQKIEADAVALEEAGVFSVVLECIPAELAGRVTERLNIPTIGIGSGAACGGQVLVLQDLLGLSAGFRPRFLRTYLDGAEQVQAALARFDAEVKGRHYPSEKESWHAGIQDD